MARNSAPLDTAQWTRGELTDQKLNAIDAAVGGKFGCAESCSACHKKPLASLSA
jgi:hypothetical protein